MRSQAELDEALDQDLSWRRTELQALLALIRSSSGPAGECLRRAGHTLLYAHWEGYTKQALLHYFTYVARKGLSYGELELNFVALAIERELRRDIGLSGTALPLRRIERLMTCQPERAPLVERDIDTKSNLNSDVLFELLSKLGLDSSRFETRRHFIDYTLLRTRNLIAHGEYADVPPDYTEVHHELIALLTAIRNEVSNAAAVGRFRRDYSSIKPR